MRGEDWVLWPDELGTVAAWKRELAFYSQQLDWTERLAKMGWFVPLDEVSKVAKAMRKREQVRLLSFAHASVFHRRGARSGLQAGLVY